MLAAYVPWISPEKTEKWDDGKSTLTMNIQNLSDGPGLIDYIGIYTVQKGDDYVPKPNDEVKPIFLGPRESYPCVTSFPPNDPVAKVRARFEEGMSR